jgi:hypothetical protein
MRFGETFCLYTRFSPEDGDSMFLRNGGIYLQLHTALQPNMDIFTIAKTSSQIFWLYVTPRISYAADNPTLNKQETTTHREEWAMS